MKAGRVVEHASPKGADKPGGNLRTSDYTVVRSPHHDLTAAPDSNSSGRLRIEAIATGYYDKDGDQSKTSHQKCG